jgi:hypothetical protein
MRAIVFCVMYFLILSLLSLLFGLDFDFSTLGVDAFRMALSIVTLCIGSGRIRSVGFVTLGGGISFIGSSICAGLVVSSKVTCRGAVGTMGSSGAGSGSGVLLRMSFSFVSASI